VLIHGILTGGDSMLLIEEEIMRVSFKYNTDDLIFFYFKNSFIKHHRGTKVYNIHRFAGWSSLENAWYQVTEMGKDLMEICDKHPEGIHLIGYSQGGLIGRTILQAFPNHNVKNFISLSSPQAGQYGSKLNILKPQNLKLTIQLLFSAAFLHLIFPTLVAKTAYELFYSHVGQHTSVGNYWNDPQQQELYEKYSKFLPYVNNELTSENSTQFRNSLLKLNKMVLVGIYSSSIHKNS
jgi:palmitoyl-protein thioesterase